MREPVVDRRSLLQLAGAGLVGVGYDRLVDRDGTAAAAAGSLDGVVIDDFSDTNIHERYEPGWQYREDEVRDAFTVTSNRIGTDSEYMLIGTQGPSDGKNPNLYSLSGLNYYPSRGDVIEFTTRQNHRHHTPSFYFGFQDPQNHYRVLWDSREDLNPLNPNTLTVRAYVDNEIVRQQRVDAPFSEYARQTLRCRIEWFDTITATFDTLDGERVAAAEMQSLGSDRLSAGGVGFHVRGHYERDDEVAWGEVVADRSQAPAVAVGVDDTRTVSPLSVPADAGTGDQVELFVENRESDPLDEVTVEAAFAADDADVAVEARSGEEFPLAVPTTVALDGEQRQPVTAEVTAAGVHGERELVVTADGPALDAPVERTLTVTFGGDLSVEAEVRDPDRPLVPGERARISLSVTSGAVMGAMAPTVRLTFPGSGEWDPVLDAADPASPVEAGGTWRETDGGLEWSNDARLAPGGTFEPAVSVVAPASLPPVEETADEGEAEVAPEDGVDAAATLGVTGAIDPRDAERQRVDDAELVVPFATDPLALRLASPEGAIEDPSEGRLEVVVETTADVPVDVQDVSVELADVPGSHADDPEASFEPTDLSESDPDRYDASLGFVRDEGLESVAEIRIDEGTVAPDDPIRGGIEFTLPTVQAVVGSNPVVATATFTRGERGVADDLGATTTITTGDLIARIAELERLADRVDELATFDHSFSLPGAVVSEPAGRLREWADDVVSAVEDDDHPLTVDVASDAVDRMLGVALTQVRLAQAVRPEKPRDGAPFGSPEPPQQMGHNLAYRAAADAWESLLTAGILGKLAGKAVTRVGKRVDSARLRNADEAAQNAYGEIATLLAEDDEADVGELAVDEIAGDADAVRAVQERAGEDSVVSDAVDEVLGEVDVPSEAVIDWIASRADAMLPGGALWDRLVGRLFGGLWGKIEPLVDDAVGSLFDGAASLRDGIERVADRVEVAVEEGTDLANAVLDEARDFYRVACWVTATVVYTEVLGPNDAFPTPPATERQREQAAVMENLIDTQNVSASRDTPPSVFEQVTLATATLSPDRIGEEGLPGDQSTAESVNAANWITEQAAVTTDALNLFSQDVTFLSGLDSLNDLVSTAFAELQTAVEASRQGNVAEFLGAAVGAYVAYVKFSIDLIGKIGSLTVGTIINTAVGTVMIQVLKFWSTLGMAGTVLGTNPGLVDPQEGVFG